MKTIIRLAVAGLSVLALTTPSLAAKADRRADWPARHAAVKRPAPAAQVRAPVISGTDWDFLRGVDRASSPYGHDSH